MLQGSMKCSKLKKHVITSTQVMSSESCEVSLPVLYNMPKMKSTIYSPNNIN